MNIYSKFPNNNVEVEFLSWFDREVNAFYILPYQSIDYSSFEYSFLFRRFVKRAWETTQGVLPSLSYSLWLADLTRLQTHTLLA